MYLPVRRELNYETSVFAKYVSGPRSLGLSIRKRNQPDVVLASRDVTLMGDTWQKYSMTLHIPEGMLAELEPADFVLAVP